VVIKGFLESRPLHLINPVLKIIIEDAVSS